MSFVIALARLVVLTGSSAAFLIGCGNDRFKSVVSHPGGTEYPIHLLHFNNRGECDTNRTRSAVMAELRGGRHTDIFVYVHGWNNEPAEAVKKYASFFTNFEKLRSQTAVGGAGYRPMYVGLLWDSTALVFPWDRYKPEPSPVDRQAAHQLVADADPAGETDLRFLLQRRSLSDAEGRRVANLLAAQYRAGDDADEITRATAADTPGMSAGDELFELWRRVPAIPDVPATPPHAVTPHGATPLSLDPRKLVRVLTFRKYRSRAGVIGTNGAAHFLADVLRAAPTARVHLVGHSYGTKVICSAIASANAQRPVQSALLLQPAISAWSFATRTPDPDQPTALVNRPGRYADVPQKVIAPIFCTYSEHDEPLYHWFERVMHRPDDIGEHHLMKTGTKTDSPYIALGGYGARGFGPPRMVSIRPIRTAPHQYDLDPGTRVVSLDGSGGEIYGHGAVDNEQTWWAMCQLVARP